MSLDVLLERRVGQPFPWAEAVAAFPSLETLRGCEQDPIYHQEGDVWVHTKQVCDALWAGEGLHALPALRRGALMLAALLHDIAKPSTQRIEADGRIRNHGHSRRGAVDAERIFWEAKAPFAMRRLAVTMIRAHAAPMNLFRRPRPRRLVYRLSWQLFCRDLARLALADVRGRLCDDRAALVEAIQLFEEQCREEGCLEEPRRFACAHSRTMYFRKEDRDASYAAHDDTWGEVVLLSGLPGAGKDHFVEERLAGLPVVDLDAIRAEMGIDPQNEQGAVINEARERARAHLRRRESFAWNATNLSLQLRAPLVELFLGYGARVKIAYVEASAERLFAQNTQRRDAVPRGAILRLMKRWEVPTHDEAHTVEYWVDGALEPSPLEPV